MMGLRLNEVLSALKGEGVEEQNLAQADSKQRVAYDLMCAIADEEGKQRYGKPDPRTYYLTLYHQCLRAVSGSSLEDVLREDILSAAMLTRRGENLG